MFVEELTAENITQIAKKLGIEYENVCKEKSTDTTKPVLLLKKSSMSNKIIYKVIAAIYDFTVIITDDSNKKRNRIEDKANYIECMQSIFSDYMENYIKFERYYKNKARDYRTAKWLHNIEKENQYKALAQKYCVPADYCTHVIIKTNDDLEK